MQINQRKAGVALNYVSEGVKIVTALVYTPLMLRLLGQSEYGLYQLTNSTVSYLSLLSLGFGSAYVRFFARYRAKSDEEGVSKLNGMFLIIFSVMAVICLGCGIALLSNAGAIFGTGLTTAELQKAKILLAILVVNMAISFPKSVFDCYVTAHEQFLYQKLLSLASGILNPFLALPLLIIGYGSVALVMITVLLNVASFASDVIFCFRKLKIKFVMKKFDFHLLKEMWTFTSFILLNQIIDQLNWSIDKLLLGRMIGTAAVAVYGVGGQINSLYIQTSISVSSVFTPKVNQIVAESDDNEALLALMIRVGRIQFMIIVLVLSGFAFFGRAFIQLWAGDGYADAYLVALLLMCPMLVPLIQNIGLEIQRAKNMHRARSIAYALLAFCNLILSVFLIRKWGCVGAAAGTAVTQTCGVVFFMNWYYHKKIGIDMIAFWKNIAKFIPSVLAVCLFGVIYCGVITVSSWVELIGSVAIYILVYITAMWLFGMNTYEKQLITGLIRKQ